MTFKFGAYFSGCSVNRTSEAIEAKENLKPLVKIDEK